MTQIAIDNIDRQIINQLQGGFPVSERPYADVAAALGLDEEVLIGRIARMVKDDVLSRFGPMYNAERLGGAVTLCAMEVPQQVFDKVAGHLREQREVAHNYARDHQLNMWFVIATETPREIEETIARIEAETGLKVYNFPKSQEFFVGLKVPA